MQLGISFQTGKTSGNSYFTIEMTKNNTKIEVPFVALLFTTKFPQNFDMKNIISGFFMKKKA
jgi:hypothetical protein